jgi:hypothetical protein
MLIDDFSVGPIAMALAEATGQSHRDDPVLPRTGGPAGNAVLTAWTGLVLLVLSVGELLTLFDVRGLISWHVALGALLIPPALLKTATTGWRMSRYYLGETSYKQAGPPPLLLRLLGPLVVISTLGLLASGVLLVILGDQTSRNVLFTVIGQQVNWVTVHQAAFIVWGSVTGLHLLGRIVPALRIVSQRGAGRVPGRVVRGGILAIALAGAAALAVLLVHVDGSWAHDHSFHH